MKLSDLFLDMRVYRGSDIGSDHILTLAELRFPPRWLGLPRTLHPKEIYFAIKLYYSMTKAHVGYTNKEFNRNYKKFQKAAIYCCNEGACD